MTDAITMNNAHKVFDFMQQTAKELTGWGLQFHTFSPFWPQGETKLILEMYYCTPGRLQTPEGTVIVFGSGCRSEENINKIMEIFTDKLGLELYKDSYTTSLGDFRGPYYLITKIPKRKLREK